MKPEFDARDEEIRLQRQAERRKLDALTSLPRESDVIVLPDGGTRRVANSYHDAAQPTIGPGWDESFHFGFGGHMSFSGSLGGAIPNTQFTLLPDLMDALVWFFHHAKVKGYNSVYCQVAVRAWAYTP